MNIFIDLLVGVGGTLGLTCLAAAGWVTFGYMRDRRDEEYCPTCEWYFRACSLEDYWPGEMPEHDCPNRKAES